MLSSHHSRRLVDERRYLDSLLLERHRLSDPYEERRRMDDITARRHYLDHLERDRLDDMMARRERLGVAGDKGEDMDIDMLRLKRFEER